MIPPDLIPIKKALLSIYSKEGIEPLVEALVRYGVELYATQGTASFLEQRCRVKCHRVESLTQFPEMMDGRVKTLHPRIFGGVLARRDNAQDLDEAKKFEVPLFDLVVGNLYPFHEHLEEAPDAQSPFIDIGGPSLLRAAAKNFAGVCVLSDPSDYGCFIEALQKSEGKTSRAFRFEAAGKTFERTSRYDAMIAAEWRHPALPTSLSLSSQQKLRYGENPHQAAAWCPGTGEKWRVLQGKELSFNNLLDAEAALRLAMEFIEPTVAIVKHNNPCGLASGQVPLESLFGRALASDPKSAFGGIVAVNATVDGEAAKAMAGIFLEVIAAQGFTSEALSVLSAKKNLRLVCWPKPTFSPFDVRSALGGWLVQESDLSGEPKLLRTVTRVPFPESARADGRVAWLTVKHVKSNAIVIAKGGATVGIGAGQMSRIDAVEIAVRKAAALGALEGAVLASDAFFPFRDNIDVLKGTGVKAILQPGGSQRDLEVIAACDELGIAMAFTGERHFRH